MRGTAVSARARLLREMTHNHLYMTDESAAELVQAALDEHAHQLAERQRAFARRIEKVHANDTGRHAEDAATRRRSWDTAADLIDPTVDSLTGRPLTDPEANQP
jgi:hypothetical protein